MELSGLFQEFSSSLDCLKDLGSDNAQAILKDDQEEQMEEDYASLWRTKINQEDLEYSTTIHQYIGYIHSALLTLKNRDQRQVDQEELERFLREEVAERDRLTATGRQKGINTAKLGMTGYFSDKINDFKGINPESTRSTLIQKTDSRIKELEEMTAQTELANSSFNENVKREMERWEEERQRELKILFVEKANIEITFHTHAMALWENDL